MVHHVKRGVKRKSLFEGPMGLKSKASASFVSPEEVAKAKKRIAANLESQKKGVMRCHSRHDITPNAGHAGPAPGPVVHPKL